MRSHFKNLRLRWNGAMTNGKRAEILADGLGQGRRAWQDKKVITFDSTFHWNYQDAQLVWAFGTSLPRCIQFELKNLSWQTQFQIKLNCFTFLPSLFRETDAKAMRWKRWIIILMTFFKTALFLLFFLHDFMIRLCWFMLITRNWSFWLFSRFLERNFHLPELDDDEVVGRSENKTPNGWRTIWHFKWICLVGRDEQIGRLKIVLAVRNGLKSVDGNFPS